MKLSRTVTGLLAVALTAFMVSDSLGQQQGGRRPQGGRPQGGPGGFGQRGGGPGGFGQRGGDPLLGLLRIEEVKVEIEVDPSQDEAITKLLASGNERGERPNFDFQNATEEARNEFFAKMRAEQEARNKKMREELETVLALPQMERLEEIALQVRGVQALTDDKVAAKLKITAAQKKELEAVQEKAQQEMRAKMQELFQGGNQGGDREGIREAFTKMREDSEKQILGVLTASQQKDFEAMKGKPFAMPEGAQRGGFGGRGGPGGGPGGRAGRGRPPVQQN